MKSDRQWYIPALIRFASSQPSHCFLISKVPSPCKALSMAVCKSYCVITITRSVHVPFGQSSSIFMLSDGCRTMCLWYLLLMIVFGMASTSISTAVTFLNNSFGVITIMFVKIGKSMIECDGFVRIDPKKLQAIPLDVGKIAEEWEKFNTRILSKTPCPSSSRTPPPVRCPRS